MVAEVPRFWVVWVLRMVLTIRVVTRPPPPPPPPSPPPPPPPALVDFGGPPESLHVAREKALLLFRIEAIARWIVTLDHAVSLLGVLREASRQQGAPVSLLVDHAVSLLVVRRAELTNLQFRTRHALFQLNLTGVIEIPDRDFSWTSPR